MVQSDKTTTRKTADNELDSIEELKKRLQELNEQQAVKPKEHKASQDDAKARQEDKGESKQSKFRKKMPKKERKEKPSKSKKVENPALAAIEGFFAATIDAYDKLQGKLYDGVWSALRSVFLEYHNMRKRYRGNSKRMMQGFVSLFIVICVMVLTFEHFIVYEYAYNGRVLGYVNAQETVVDLLAVAGQGMSDSNDIDVSFKPDDNITFKRVAVGKKDLDNSDQVLNKLTYMTDVEVTASGIYLDGKLVTICDKDSTANAVLEDVKAHYSTPDEGMKIDELTIDGEITIEPIDVMLTNVQTQKAAGDSLIEGETVDLRHIVKDGESIKDIAEKFNVQDSEVLEVDTDEPVIDVEPGEQVRVHKKIEPLSVRMVESGTMSEVIEFETEEKKTDELYKGDTEIEQEGENGRQVITGTLTKVNGKEVKRDLTNKWVAKEPVKEIILIGTSETPVARPTGTYVMPLHGGYTYTSGFGARWGSVHKGIDLACPNGTPVFAADGGRVIRASWFSGYGNCIDIEHKDGTFTRYGHLDGYSVDVGEDVYQGQEIGASGNTGFSTGPHLHFEIHPGGGDPVDPAPYVGLGASPD